MPYSLQIYNFLSNSQNFFYNLFENASKVWKADIMRRCFLECTEASAISSLQRNSLNGFPVPHKTTLLSYMPYLARTRRTSSFFEHESLESLGPAALGIPKGDACCRRDARNTEITEIFLNVTQIARMTRIFLSHTDLTDLTDFLKVPQKERKSQKGAHRSHG